MRSRVKSPPHVVLITDSRAPSGVGHHMMALATELRDRCRISFVFPNASGAVAFVERARALGHPVEVLDPEHLRWWPEILAERLRSMEPDLLHIHAGIGWEGNRAGMAARKAGVPANVRTEHLPYMLQRRVQRREHLEGLTCVDHVICVSEQSFESHVRAGLPVERFSVVRNGISLPRARRSRAETRATFRISPEELLVITVARLIAQKGHRVLLNAIPQILAEQPHTHFLWVGEGRLRAGLEREAAAAGLSDRIIFAGSRDDVPDLLAAADAFVLPSEFEGLPLALIEAMAAGLPVVATRVPGTTEVITNDAGQLVPPRDPAALATGVVTVLRDPDQSRAMAERGRVLAERDFSARRMADEVYAIYRSVLAQANRRSPQLERRVM